MGKTYRTVFSGSQSEDYHSPHSRKILGNKKKYTRKQIRNNNKQCKEDSIKSSKDIKNKIKNHFASGYYGKIGNVPNIPSVKLNDVMNLKMIILHRWFCNSGIIQYAKWNNDGNRDEIINEHIKNKHHDIKYLIATQKQIQRRGKPERFVTHR